MATQGERALQVREAMGKTQGEIAAEVRRLGGAGYKFGQTALSKFEKGGNSHHQPLIAMALGVEPFWLMTGRGNKYPATQGAVNLSGGSQDDDVMLYQYGDPRCPHGPNRVGAAELPTVAVPRRALERHGIDEAHAVGYIQPDGTQAPAMELCDEAAIDVRERDPSKPKHNGKLFAIVVGDALVVRRIVVDAMGRATIEPGRDAPRGFEPLVVERWHSIEIFGRAAWISGGR